MNVRVIFALAAAAALMLVVAGTSLVMAKRGASDSSVLTPDQGWEGTVVPAFHLVDQEGERVDESVFQGEVTILDFIFTNCPLQCPIMTSTLVGISERTEGSGLRFVSMSIDPLRDSPSALAEHASRFGIDLDRWSFVTEQLEEEQRPADVVRELLRNGLGYDVRENDDADPLVLVGGETMLNIVHPGVFFLIGPDREVLGTYIYNQPEQIEDLVSRAVRAAKITAKTRR